VGAMKFDVERNLKFKTKHEKLEEIREKSFEVIDRLERVLKRRDKV
jgi:hypothetical protein